MQQVGSLSACLEFGTQCSSGAGLSILIPVTNPNSLGTLNVTRFNTGNMYYTTRNMYFTTRNMYFTTRNMYSRPYI